MQLCFEVDWSSGHSKKKEDGLSTNDMNESFGDRQPMMHSTVITEGCLGSNSPTVTNHSQMDTTPTLSIGDEQFMMFLVGDAPPIYHPTDLKENVIEYVLRKKIKAQTREEEKKQMMNHKSMKKKSRSKGMWMHLKVIQVLAEQGLYKPGMRLQEMR